MTICSGVNGGALKTHFWSIHFLASSSCFKYPFRQFFSCTLCHFHGLLDPSVEVPKMKFPIASRDLSLNKLAIMDADADVSAGWELGDKPSRNSRILRKMVHGMT